MADQPKVSKNRGNLLPTYSEEAEKFRATVQSFLKTNLPSDWEGIGSLNPEEAYEFANTVWRPLLADNGYLAPSWPKEVGGGGLSELEQVILAEEFMNCLLYTSPSPRDRSVSRMPSSA